MLPVGISLGKIGGPKGTRGVCPTGGSTAVGTEAGAGGAFALLRAGGFFTAGFRAVPTAAPTRERFAAGFFEFVTCTFSFDPAAPAGTAGVLLAPAFCATNPGGSFNVTFSDVGLTSLATFLVVDLRFPAASATFGAFGGAGGLCADPSDDGVPSSDESELELSSSLLDRIESLLDESAPGGGGGGDTGGIRGGGGDEGGGGGGGAALEGGWGAFLALTGERLGAAGLRGGFFLFFLAPTEKSESESSSCDSGDSGGGLRGAAFFLAPAAGRGLRAVATAADAADADEEDAEDEDATDEDEDETSSSESDDRLEELLDMYLAPASMAMKSASAMPPALGSQRRETARRPAREKRARCSVSRASGGLPVAAVRAALDASRAASRRSAPSLDGVALRNLPE